MRLGSAPLSALGGAFLFCSLENTACFPEGRTGRAQPCPWPMAGRSWVGKPGWCGPQALAPRTRPGWTTTRGTRGACPLTGRQAGAGRTKGKRKSRRPGGERGPGPRRSPWTAPGSTGCRRQPGSPTNLQPSLPQAGRSIPGVSLAACSRQSGVTRQGRDGQGRATRTGRGMAGSGRDGQVPAAAGRIALSGSGEGRHRRPKLERGARLRADALLLRRCTLLDRCYWSNMSCMATPTMTEMPPIARMR